MSISLCAAWSHVVCAPPVVLNYMVTHHSPLTTAVTVVTKIMIEKKKDVNTNQSYPPPYPYIIQTPYRDLPNVTSYSNIRMCVTYVCVCAGGINLSHSAHHFLSAVVSTLGIPSHNYL